jgi:hypothetical protein
MSAVTGLLKVWDPVVDVDHVDAQIAVVGQLWVCQEFLGSSRLQGAHPEPEDWRLLLRLGVQCLQQSHLATGGVYTENS